MLKLYKRIHDRLHYWQTWKKDEETAITYWGVVGHIGEYKEVKSGMATNMVRAINSEIRKKTKEGFVTVDNDKILFLEIKYKIDSFETEKNLKKRHRLKEKLDEILGLTGLGYSSRGAIDDETMEIKCVVINYTIAKNTIEEELKNTEFEDYIGIYKKEQ
ncbi:hypothetical protein [Flavobacterium pectinovorum]|uniref:WGR domain-containing protein n=1 Tax=Flavobacterium pectinovorum TaxID=29533 RepID=A0A502EX23_9FLAO|nr:hypothetical protein [Flavobacterium pectinovorum]TPG42273.1 hypothetical protein EAH81_08125 [Flavobacterium pectinovorum]